MRYFFFLILLTFSGTAFSQKIFHVYDGFTLELIDSVDVTANKDKVEGKTVAFGIYRVRNAERGTQLTFTKPGYLPQYFDCSDDKAESYTIMLDPTESLLKSYQAKLPYYPTKVSLLNITGSEGVSKAETDNIPKVPVDTILSVVDVLPAFPGGQPALMKYLQNNIHYPPQALDLGISGKVYLQFVVSTTGKVSNVRVKRGLNLPMDEESYRVVKAMPDWTPGYVKGKAVNSYFSLPIYFKLQ